MQHYARGVAHATLKNIAEAERERLLFHESPERIPPGRRFLSNPVHAMLAVGEKMLDGELEYHRGGYDRAYEHLRDAVRRDDNLPYTEPWAWMPCRMLDAARRDPGASWFAAEARRGPAENGRSDRIVHVPHRCHRASRDMLRNGIRPARIACGQSADARRDLRAA